jgi:hypothetical protein
MVFHSEPIMDDGWRVTDIGDIRLRVNVDHVQLSRTAIRRRWKHESAAVFETTVVKLNTHKRRNSSTV